VLALIAGRSLAYWRSGSKTVVPEALRYLETL
jgi:hypothetical protein